MSWSCRYFSPSPPIYSSSISCFLWAYALLFCRADLSWVHRRLQGVLPRRPAKAGLATHDRTEEAVSNSLKHWARRVVLQLEEPPSLLCAPFSRLAGRFRHLILASSICVLSFFVLTTCKILNSKSLCYATVSLSPHWSSVKNLVLLNQALRSTSPSNLPVFDDKRDWRPEQRRLFTCSSCSTTSCLW